MASPDRAAGVGASSHPARTGERVLERRRGVVTPPGDTPRVNNALRDDPQAVPRSVNRNALDIPAKRPVLLFRSPGSVGEIERLMTTGQRAPERAVSARGAAQERAQSETAAAHAAGT